MEKDHNITNQNSKDVLGPNEAPSLMVESNNKESMKHSGTRLFKEST